MYRDCWDNKPPGVYYLNAIFISLTGATPWSLWLGQTVWLSITTTMLFVILKELWGKIPAGLSTALMLLSLLDPTFFEGGNLTETYAMLPSTLALGAFLGYVQTDKKRYLVGIGLASAFSFLFKPTYISFGLAASFVLLLAKLREKRYRQFTLNSAIILVGFLFPLSLTAGFWLLKNNFYELLYAVFIHNQLYVQEGFTLPAVYHMLLRFLNEQPLMTLTLLAVISFSAFTSFYILAPKPDLIATRSPKKIQLYWMLVLGITIILDLVFTSLSGKNFNHYFQIPILPLAASSAYLFHRLNPNHPGFPKKDPYAIITLCTILIILLAWSINVIRYALPNTKNLRGFLANPNVTVYQPNQIETFILENSQPDESILVWDYDPVLYFHTGRRSPTRYIFLRHLYTPTPTGVNGFDEFLQELENDPPVLILTSKSSQQGLPYLGFDEAIICSDCPDDIRQGVVQVKRYLSEYYQPYLDVGTWAVYTRIK